MEDHPALFAEVELAAGACALCSIRVELAFCRVVTADAWAQTLILL